MKKRDIPRIIFISLVVLMLLAQLIVNINPRDFINSQFYQRYPERTVYVQELAVMDILLHNFALNEDGSITTTDSESWIALFYGQTEIYKYADIDMYLSLKEPSADSCNIWTIGRYKYSSASLHEGVVSIPVDNLTSEDLGIRIDLGNEAGETYRVDKIVINDNQKLTKRFIGQVNETVWVMLYAILLFFFIVLGRNVGARKELAPFESGKPKKIYKLFAQGYELVIGFTVIISFGVLLCLLGLPQLLMFVMPILCCFGLGVLCDCVRLTSNRVIQYIVSVIGIVLISAFIFISEILREGSGLSVLNEQSNSDWYVLFLVLLSYEMAVLIMSFFDASRLNASDEQIRLRNVSFAIAFLIITVIDITIVAVANSYSREEIINDILQISHNGSVYMDAILFFLLYLTLVNLIGKGLSNLLGGIALFVVCAGNAIEINYQNKIFQLSDIKLAGEVIEIGGGYLNIAEKIGIIVLIIAIIVGAVLLRKRILKLLKPSILISSLFIIPIIIFVSVGYTAEQQKSFDIALYTKCRFCDYYLKELLADKGYMETDIPNNYSEELYDSLDDIPKIELVDDGVKPNVVLIMAESFCDIESNQDSVTFDRELMPYMRDNQVATVISPSYGGRTVMSEYEALTGLSNYTIASDNVVYTSYLNERTKPLGGLPNEFEYNGYKTVAIHPNTANFYNRDVVYSDMGFDDYISIDDYDVSGDDLLADGRMKDSAFFESVRKQLESSDEPQFIFGVTIAAHAPYLGKYSDSEVKASSDKYSGDDLIEAQNYAETVYELNNSFEDFCDWLDTIDTPTIVYVWGDHLPALEIYRDNLSDVNLKYSVPLVAYSNYKDIKMDVDTISPNQIATQIIKDSGIKHHSYMDYIYSLRKTTPVLQKEYTGELEDETIEMYRAIQYDFIFGQKYCLDDE